MPGDARGTNLPNRDQTLPPSKLTLVPCLSSRFTHSSDPASAAKCNGVRRSCVQNRATRARLSQNCKDNDARSSLPMGRELASKPSKDSRSRWSFPLSVSARHIVKSPLAIRPCPTDIEGGRVGQEDDAMRDSKKRHDAVRDTAKGALPCTVRTASFYEEFQNCVKVWV